MSQKIKGGFFQTAAGAFAAGAFQFTNLYMAASTGNPVFWMPTAASTIPAGVTNRIISPIGVGAVTIDSGDGGDTASVSMLALYGVNPR